MSVHRFGWVMMVSDGLRWILVGFWVDFGWVLNSCLMDCGWMFDEFWMDV